MMTIPHKSTDDVESFLSTRLGSSLVSLYDFSSSQSNKIFTAMRRRMSVARDDVVHERRQIRSFGSNASRNESPKRLKAKTDKLMAMPG
jgi:hypothetical protein